MTKVNVTAQQFAQKITKAWNVQHGTEWNNKAGGFVKANFWDKKPGEIRIYFGKAGYARVLPKDDGAASIKLFNIKYELTDSIWSVIKEIAANHKVSGWRKEEASQELLAARFGWHEVIDAENDVAREDNDL